LKADPSDGSPRGKLRDFASADDASTKRCDSCDGGSCDSCDGGSCDDDEGGETLAAFDAAAGGLCRGDAGTGRRI
jgi:hypothetical protein